MLKIIQLIFFVLFSIALSTPRWINDVSDDKNWVGIGVVNSRNLPPGSDPIETAFNNAVKSIASQISIQIEASMSEELKDSVYFDDQGNAISTFSSSFKNSLSAKVRAKLDGVKKVKADSDGNNYYCKASLSMKKYWKDMERRRDDAISYSKSNIEKALTAEFDGNLFKYLDEALFHIFEFQGGVSNDFVDFGPPEITISICPESGTKIASEDNNDDDLSIDANEDNSTADEDKAKSKLKEKKKSKFDKLREKSKVKLDEMRERINYYNSFFNETGEIKDEIIEDSSNNIPNENNQVNEANEINSRVNDAESSGIVDTRIISAEEDECKKCLNFASCENPFNEECECSETCGIAIAKEVCQEKTILLAPYITQMLDGYLQRINFSGNETPINIKFGNKYNRLTFRSTDSYLDKMSFKSLDQLVKMRETLVYKSPEWAKVQNLINQLLNNKTRHNEGIVSLPLFNIPIKYCIGLNNCSNIYTDKAGYFDIDFPKYIHGDDPYLYISIDNDFFKSYNPIFSPFIKIPIKVDPMYIHIEFDDINEWNDDLGYPLDSYLIEAFNNNNISFTDNKESSDKFITIKSESIINEMNNDLFKVRHITSLSFSDATGILYEKVFKSKPKTCLGSSNYDLKNCAAEAKKNLTKKFRKGLKKVESSVLK